MIDFLDILHDRNDGCLVVIMSLQDVIQLFFLFFFQYISSLFLARAAWHIDMLTHFNLLYHR